MRMAAAAVSAANAVENLHMARAFPPDWLLVRLCLLSCRSAHPHAARLASGSGSSTRLLIILSPYAIINRNRRVSVSVVAAQVPAQTTEKRRELRAAEVAGALEFDILFGRLKPRERLIEDA